MDALAKENATLRTRLNRLEGTRVASVAPNSRTVSVVPAPSQPAKIIYAASDRATAAYASAPPVWNWTGCYLGAQAGYGTIQDNSLGAPIDGGGALAGGQVGCNHQMNILVFGVEGEGLWSGMKSTLSSSGAGFTQQFTTKNTSDYDIAARFGFAYDRALIYGKAGWVWGQFNWRGTTSLGSLLTGSSTLDGLFLGLGLEYGITPNWSAKVEYDYFGFANNNVTFINTCAGCSNSNLTASAEKHIVKVGLNYKFDVGKGPVANRY